MRSFLELLVPATLVSACFLSGEANPGSDPPPPAEDAGMPFQADPPSVYVAKVKDILTGLAPLQPEIDQVANASDSRAALVSLIDKWMATPEYQTKMLRFFQLALQQTQISTADFVMQIPGNQSIAVSSTVGNLLVQNASEAVARTALELISEGQPLNSVVTTHTFMMTPPLMELYAFMDAYEPDDDENLTDYFASQNPNLTIVVEDTQSIPVTDSVNPNSPNYMHWYYPGLSTAEPKQPVGCQADVRNYPVDAQTLHNLLYGSLAKYTLGDHQGSCNAYSGDMSNSQFTTADFSAWKMVTIRAPNKGESTSPFWDPGFLRSTDTLVLRTPRVGFFTSPAFGANWPTNTSNLMRATMNQALIVATGMQVDGTDATPLPPNPPGVDQSHASQPACYGCHQYLDTTRSILQATYSDNYAVQTDSMWTGTKGWFAFQGIVDQNIATVDDLARDLANHPAFAGAWVQKLCFYANSTRCAPDDPELQRIVSVFQSSGFAWPKLVEDLLSSPITTNASESRTAAEDGETVSIARVDQLCGVLDARLGLTDVCALTAANPPNSGLPLLASGLPSDGYGRGAPVPLLPRQPTLFYRAGAENMCELVAALLIDDKKPPAGAKTYSSATPDSVASAIADFVASVMGLEASDPRASAALQALQAHYQSAITQPQSPASPTDALRSTFTVACLSPSVLGVGL